MPIDDDLSTNRASTLRGLVTVDSPWSFEDTVQRLLGVIRDKGLRVFDVIDHAAAAAEVDQVLRPTRVVIFGSPAVGTPLMVQHPLLAFELPLRILVWQDGDTTRVSYTDAAVLARRFEIDPVRAAPLHAPMAVVAAATDRGGATPP